MPNHANPVCKKENLQYPKVGVRCLEWMTEADYSPKKPQKPWNTIVRTPPSPSAPSPRTSIHERDTVNIDRALRPGICGLVLGYLLSAATLATANLSAQAPERRLALLTATSDSIREGRYEWAGTTLTAILELAPSDWEARSLLALALAGKGEIGQAKNIAAGLADVAGAEQARTIVSSAIAGFEASARLRTSLIAALKVGDVRRAWAEAQSSGVDASQLALVRATLCVLTGNRPCFETSRSQLEPNVASSPALEALDRQLLAAERAARAYGLALMSFAGTLEPGEATDSLVLAEVAQHRACERLPYGAFMNDAKTERNALVIVECWQGLMARLAALGARVFELAPLSRTGLESALMVAVLTEPVASVDTALARMQRVDGNVLWPLWQQQGGASRAVLRLKDSVIPMMLWITDSAVSLVRAELPSPRLEALSFDFGSENAQTSYGARLRTVEWTVPRSDLSGASKVVLRQPIDWAGGRKLDFPRRLGPDGPAVELGTKSGKYRIPHPVGVFHFARAYGEVTTRAVLRTFGRSLQHLLGLQDVQVELVDSVRGTSLLKGIAVVAVAAASVATYQPGSGVNNLTVAEGMVTSEEARIAEDKRQYSTWIRATERNPVVRNALELTVSQRWLKQLLENLPLFRKPAG